MKQPPVKETGPQPSRLASPIRLRCGGMGEVYRADDIRMDLTVALKSIAPGRMHDAAWLSRFLNEARIALNITHPNICRVYDVCEAAGEAFISMEFVDGENLQSLLRRIGRLPREKMVDITRQLCGGAGLGPPAGGVTLRSQAGQHHD